MSRLLPESVSLFERALLALLLVFVASCASKTPWEPGPDPTPEGTGYRTENTVLVIIDGLRYSEGLGDPEALYTPRMHELAHEGAIVEPFLNDGATVTRRGVPAIWTGSWQAPETFSDPDCGGSENQRATVPTLFEYWRKLLDRPAEDCIYLTGQVGCPWKASDDPEYGPDYWPLLDETGSNDRERGARARFLLEQVQPALLLLYLPDVDHGGHSGEWNQYIANIAVADSIVGAIWDFLQTSPHYADHTTLFVTNDHGRHDNRPTEPHDGFSGHGDGCHGCRTIELLMVGPDTRPGLVSTQPRTIPDIVPTIGELLGFPTPEASGEAMAELLVDR